MKLMIRLSQLARAWSTVTEQSRLAGRGAVAVASV
jgi:hypothetical protein